MGPQFSIDFRRNTVALRSTEGLSFGFGAVTVNTGPRTDKGHEPATCEIRNVALL